MVGFLDVRLKLRDPLKRVLGVVEEADVILAELVGVLIRQVDLVQPASGSGGGSPGSSGGFVCIDMWLIEDLLAGDAQIGNAVDGSTYAPIGTVPCAVTVRMFPDMFGELARALRRR